MISRKILRCALVAELCPPPPARSIPVLVQCRYDTRDPYTLSLRFLTKPGRWVTWSFARELVSDALVWGEAGEGDVRFRPHPHSPRKVWLSVESPTGRAEFAFARAPLAAVLDASEHLVPWGSEDDHVDWDRELARLREVA